MAVQNTPSPRQPEDIEGGELPSRPREEMSPQPDAAWVTISTGHATAFTGENAGVHRSPDGSAAG